MARLRIFVAVLAAPLAVVPVTVLLLTLLGIPSTAGTNTVLAATKVGAFCLIYAYPITVVYGVPVFFVLQRCGRLNAWSLSTAGFLPPFVIALALFAQIRPAFWLALCGLSVALVAWVITGGRTNSNLSVNRTCLQR